MNDFYNTITELYPEHHNMTATIIEGKDLGEKAIFSKGKLIFETKTGVFSKEYCNNILEEYINGIHEIDGQRYFSETLASEKKLVICGGGHVSIPIIRIGKMLEFNVTVIEDRVQYADNARSAMADEVICDDFSQALDKTTGDSDTYFVIVTRGHRYDVACLKAIIQKESAYIGMIGSKVRVKKVKELLIKDGFKSQQLDNVYSPIGLKIGARTPEEIAVSIMAEIIQIKNQVNNGCGYPKDIITGILSNEKKEIPKMLATIVSRKGSAPREIGTKMLIYMDGTIKGTIGGGCVEADVCSKARYLLMKEDKTPKLFTVDMTGREAEEEGMVCGGIVEILLEWIS